MMITGVGPPQSNEILIVPHRTFLVGEGQTERGESCEGVVRNSWGVDDSGTQRGVDNE